MQIAFVYDCFNSAKPLIVIGGQIGTNSCGIYAFQSDVTLPENITTTTGKVIFKLYKIFTSGADSTQWGNLIVQMIDNNKIKIEATTDISSSDFSNNFYYYIR